MISPLNDFARNKPNSDLPLAVGPTIAMIGYIHGLRIAQRNPSNQWLIDLLQLNTFVILFQNLVVRCAVQRHPISANLTHTDTMAPAAAVKRHTEYLTLRVPFDIERKKAVTQAQKRSQAQRTDSATSVRSGDFSAERAV